MTRAEARDAINAAVKAAVDAYLTANPTATLDVYYDDVDKAKQQGDKPHLRVFVKHNEGDQNSMGSAGNRLFKRTGVVLVQIMCPYGDGFTLDDVLATVARNAFEGVSTPNGVWFRRVSPGTEIGKTGGFTQTNVSASFEYSERR